MDQQPIIKNREDLEKIVTMGVLLEYTDEFLVPKIEEIVTDVVGASEHRMKDYIDRKLSDHTTEFFRKLEHKFQTGNILNHIRSFAFGSE